MWLMFWRKRNWRATGRWYTAGLDENKLRDMNTDILVIRDCRGRHCDLCFEPLGQRWPHASMGNRELLLATRSLYPVFGHRSVILTPSPPDRLSTRTPEPSQAPSRALSPLPSSPTAPRTLGDSVGRGKRTNYGYIKREQRTRGCSFYKDSRHANYRR